MLFPACSGLLAVIEIFSGRSASQTVSPVTTSALLSAATSPSVASHANRTTGFFKVRGVNVNHAEFEDLMFRQPMLADFQAVLFSDPETSLESLKVRIEVRRGGDATALSADVVQAIRRIFEISASIETVETGTLAAEFEKNVKAPRFLDQRI